MSLHAYPLSRSANAGHLRLGRLCAAIVPVWLAVSPTAFGQPEPKGPTPTPSCGEVVSVQTHASTSTRYALQYPKPTAPSEATEPRARVALLLLVGVGGYLKLDEGGCPRALIGNFLVRSLPHFHAEGLITALVDAPSDYSGDEGLGGFRASAQHADDLGKLIADVRARTGAAVWIVGTSRGTISSANAAARLSGAAAADGVVLTSIVTAGGSSRQRPWVSQTVFDLTLNKIQIPVLLVGHEADACIRTPPALMARVASQLGAVRKQTVIVSAGPGRTVHSGSGLEACEGRTAHGFLDQEAEVVAGIARFIRGGNY